MEGNPRRGPTSALGEGHGPGQCGGSAMAASVEETADLGEYPGDGYRHSDQVQAEPLLLGQQEDGWDGQGKVGQQPTPCASANPVLDGQQSREVELRHAQVEEDLGPHTHAQEVTDTRDDPYTNPEPGASGYPPADEKVGDEWG